MLTPQERKKLRLILVLKSDADESTGCRIWAGGIRSSDEGYGVLHFRGRADRVHRVMVMLNGVGLPVKGEVVRHICGNDRCVNPDHLAIGTPSENNKDAYAHGTRSNRNRLSKMSKRQIRELFRDGTSIREIVRQLALPRTTVRDYVRKWQSLRAIEADRSKRGSGMTSNAESEHWAEFYCGAAEVRTTLMRGAKVSCLAKLIRKKTMRVRWEQALHPLRIHNMTAGQLEKLGKRSEERRVGKECCR